MSWIVAQREIGSGLQEIVSIDLTAGVTGVLARPWEEPGLKPTDPPVVYTPQAPKTLPSGVLMAYRLRQGQQFNLDSASNELVLYDGPAGAPRVLPRPVVKSGLNTTIWVAHGHAAPTDRGTLIHAAVEWETWWIWPIPVRKQWCCVETDLNGKLTGYRVVDRAEPSVNRLGLLTMIDPSGTGRIVSPSRIFDKATSPVGAKSWGWFDPHLSPDAGRVVWLDVTSIGLDGTRSGLIVGDVATGKARYLVAPTSAMQTDAMWLDDATLLGARYSEGHWRLITIDAGSGAAKDVPNTLDCTAVHVAP